MNVEERPGAAAGCTPTRVYSTSINCDTGDHVGLVDLVNNIPLPYKTPIQAEDLNTVVTAVCDIDIARVDRDAQGSVELGREAPIAAPHPDELPVLGERGDAVVSCFGFILGCVAIAKADRAMEVATMNPGCYLGEGKALAAMALGAVDIVVWTIAAVGLAAL